MKKSGLLAAATVAATAVSASSSAHINNSQHLDGTGERSRKSSSPAISSSSEKFAPRFDGLRFIETLVTAHR